MANPVFNAPLTNPFGLTNVGSYTKSTLVDIDHDGDLDVFVGDNSGNSYYLQNTGTATNPAFAAAVTNPFGLSDIGYSSVPTFADIDNDGDQDAFVGDSDGIVRFFQNTGTDSAPAFAANVSNPFGLTDIGDAATPDFADIDHDGDLDAFVGAFDGIVRYLERESIVQAISCRFLSFLQIFDQGAAYALSTIGG